AGALAPVPANARTRHSRICAGLTGLVMHATMPTSSISWAAPRSPSDVSMISCTPAMAGSHLIARASMRPSIPGIWRSRMTSSKGRQSLGHVDDEQVDNLGNHVVATRLTQAGEDAGIENRKRRRLVTR